MLALHETGCRRRVFEVHTTAFMVRCMRSRSFAIVLVVALGTVSSLPGEDAVLQTLARGAALNAEGNFRAALTLVQPLLDSSSEKGDRAIAGVAWDIRGLALQSLGRPDEARRSYESALSILRSMPDQKIQYANALDNLGSLEAAGFATEALGKAFVEGWKKSPGHRRNMLDADVTETGVAVARSDKTWSGAA